MACNSLRYDCTLGSGQAGRHRHAMKRTKCGVECKNRPVKASGAPAILTDPSTKKPAPLWVAPASCLLWTGFVPALLAHCCAPGEAGQCDYRPRRKVVSSRPCE